MTRYEELVENQRRAALESEGVTDPALRRAVFARSAELSGGEAISAVTVEEIPADLRKFVDTAARHAYRITDEDIQELRRAGYSEDAIFEVSVAAAVGAGLSRLERGLGILRGGEK
jgi:alkylhydroperoxidase family enzyme